MTKKEWLNAAEEVAQALEKLSEVSKKCKVTINARVTEEGFSNAFLSKNGLSVGYDVIKFRGDEDWKIRENHNVIGTIKSTAGHKDGENI